MPRIDRVLAVPAVGAYYYDDLAALQAQPIPLPERYTATPVTSGFHAVREVAEAVAVGLVLDDGHVAWGDCVAVEFSGKAGRDPIFRTRQGLAAVEGVVTPALVGRELASFRELAAEVDALCETIEVTRAAPLPEPEVEDRSRRAILTAAARAFRAGQGDGAPATETVRVQQRLHTAVRYGTSQALLEAIALARGVTRAEVIAEEWDLPLPAAPVPIHAQSGAERMHNADKMIARRVASMPHALVDHVPDQLGADGAKLVQYARWLKARVLELGGPDYHPTIHLDVHGAMGKIVDDNLGRVLGHLYALEKAVEPYPLRVESPVILDSRAAQIEALRQLREYVRFRRMRVQVVADEWANTLEDIQAFLEAGAADMIQVKMPDLGSVHNSVEAVLACRAAGVGAFLGGSCAETDLSARAAVHVALATRPDLIMAKPGMGVDEGIALVHNEMARALAEIGARWGQKE